MQRFGNVDPLRGPILKNMLLFSLPVMAVGLLQMLFSAADTAVIGRFGHEGAISAIGASSSIILLAGGGLTALSAGVTIVLGQLFGSGERDRISGLLHALPLTGAALGAAAAALLIAFAKPILRLIHCPEALLDDASLYFRIYFAGLPFSMTLVFLSAALEAKGESLPPLLFSLGAAVLNVGLNLLFVIVFDWNLFGVALATVLSQAAGAAALTMYLCRRRDELRLQICRLRVFSGTGSVFSLGIPSALEGMILNFSGVVIASAINRFDAVVIAGNTIGNTLEGLVAVTFSALAGASAVFVSQNYGARNLPRVHRTWRVTLLTAFLMAEVLGVALYLVSPWLCRVFAKDPAVIEAARVRMRYMCLAYGLCGAMNVAGGCVRGLGETRIPLVISLICSVGFRITWVYTYARSRGTIGAIYLSYPLCWALNVAMIIPAFYLVYRRVAGIHHEKEALQP